MSETGLMCNSIADSQFEFRTETLSTSDNKLKMSSQLGKSDSSVKLEVSWWRKPLAIFLALGLLGILPGLTLVFIGMWIYRVSVGYLAKLIRPNLASMMTLWSTPFATDLVFSATPKIPLILAISLKGHLDISVFREAVVKLVNSKDDKNKNVLRHPELQQAVTTWLGIIFWRWVEFRVENHVNVYDKYATRPEELSEDNLLDIGNELLAQKFDKNRSPWEFLVSYNYKCEGSKSNGPSTLVILRTHHCLGDGFSLLKLFLVDLSGETLQVAKPVPYAVRAVAPNISPCQKIVQALCLPFRVSLELTTQAVNALDINEWHVAEWKVKRRINGGVTPPIPLEYVKKIKNAHGTSFTAVPLAAFTGGIRNFMMERGVRCPESIHCLIALPYPGHPWKLTNHLTGSMIELPLGLPTARERLLAIESSLLEIKSSTVPTTLFYLMKIAGIPCAFISYIFFRNLLTTAINSNFPGPAVETKFVGLPMQDAGFAVGFGSGNSVIGLGSVSYNGNIRLTAGFDEAVLPAHIPFKDVIAKIVEELKILDDESPRINTNNTNGKDWNGNLHNISALTPGARRKRR